MRRTRAVISWLAIAAGIVVVLAPRADARPNSWTVHLLIASVLWGIGLVGVATSRPVASSLGSGGEGAAHD